MKGNQKQQKVCLVAFSVRVSAVEPGLSPCLALAQHSVFDDISQIQSQLWFKRRFPDSLSFSLYIQIRRSFSPFLTKSTEILY